MDKLFTEEYDKMLKRVGVSCGCHGQERIALVVGNLLENVYLGMMPRSRKYLITRILGAQNFRLNKRRRLF